MRSSRALFIIAIFSILLFLPIILNPLLFLQRGNDLQEFFLPLFYYVKNHILVHKSLPLWNSMFLSGVPLLPDPQAPLFYLPNIVLLVLPLETGVIVSSIIHIALGGFGMYLLLSRYFKDSALPIMGAALYIVSPRLSAFIEAGHWGLIAATAWIPFVVLFTIKSIEKPTVKTSLYLALSLAGIFFTHPTTFVLLSAGVGIALVIASVRTFVQSQFLLRKQISPTLIRILVPLVTFGLVAVALLPQLKWVPETNRFLLSTDRQVWPKWASLDEFVQAITNPLLFGKAFANSLDTEKWIALGITPLLLAFVGWMKSPARRKIISAFIALVILILALNNLSPFNSLLLSQDWYVYARVSTRNWFVVSILVLYFSLVGFETIVKKSRLIAYILIVVAFAELLTLSWTRITKPIMNDRQTASSSVLDFIHEDNDTYRVFCTTRCFSQYDVAKYGLETIGGYSTLHQKNYYEHAWQMTGTYWDYYTLALPPIGSYKFGQLDPDFASLGEYNTRYVISPHILDDPYAKLLQEIDGFYIYKNEAYSPRIYYYSDDDIPVSVAFTQQSSHSFQLETTNITKPITIAIPYTKGWKAFTKSGEIQILERPNALMSLSVPENTANVTIKYNPTEYIYGKLITSATIIGILYLWKKKK